MDALERQLLAADRAGYIIDLRHAFWECVPPSVSALERPRLHALAQRIGSGDVVVTMNLSCLGRSVQDILSTIMRFRKVGVELYCVQLGRANLARKSPPSAVNLLRAVAALDEATRSERTRTSAAEAKARGKQLGRPPTLAKGHQQRVLQMLANGTSVSETARRFGTSRQTVLRIRTAHDNQDSAIDRCELVGDGPSEIAGDASMVADRSGGA